MYLCFVHCLLSIGNLECCNSAFWNYLGVQGES